MKGQIRVHSEPGKGTIFGIELPFEHAKETIEEAAMRNFSFPTFPRAMSDTSSRSVITNQKETLKEDQQVLATLQDAVPSAPTSITEIPILTTPQNQYGPFVPGLPNSRYPFPPSDHMPAQNQRETLTVLIAEDNPINSRILVRRLEKFGHTVHLAQDGQECHDHFTTKPEDCDVILMDIQVIFP